MMTDSSDLDIDAGPTSVSMSWSTPDENVDYQAIARNIIRKTIFDRFVDANTTVPQFDVYVVWFAKTLKNWKALLSSSIPDGAYYEVTYDGHNGVAYVDSYKKFDNRVIAIPARSRS